MKSIFTLLFMTIACHNFSQSSIFSPLSIEDPKISSYLQTRKLPELTVRVINNREKGKKVNITYTIVSFGPAFQVKELAQLNENNEAKITLKANLPYQQIWLTVENYLYTGVYVNADLTVTIDAAKIKERAYRITNGIEFSGTDGELNKVMNESALFKYEKKSELFSLLQKRAVDNSNATLERKKNDESVLSFITISDSIYRALNEIDKDFIARYPKYAWAVKNETDSEFYGNLCIAFSYGIMPDHILARVSKHMPYFTSNEGVLFYRYFSKYIRYNKNRVVASFYPEIFNRYNGYSSAQKAIIDSVKRYEHLTETEKKKNTSTLKAHYRQLNELFYKELLALRIETEIRYIDSFYTRPRADILKLFLLKDGKDVFDITYPTILRHTETGWCKKLIENELAESSEKQKAFDALLAGSNKINNTENYIGKPLLTLPFGAELYKLDSLSGIDNFILNLKSKFRNKAIVIDFWATWCVPCINDMPYSKKLHEENKDLPIEYVYLCTNSNSTEEIWKKRVAELKNPGTHIFVDDEIISKLKSKLDADGGFPRYTVIDINGKNHPEVIKFMHSVDRGILKRVTGL